MARLDVLEYPDPRLRTIARPVSGFDAGLRRLLGDMLETLYATRALGLAATQVDVHLRVIAIDVSETADEPRLFINPQLLARDRYAMVEEGCLSLPGIHENVKRATIVRVRAAQPDGVSYETDLEGMAAVCLQHEMDHLDGKLFLDHLSFFRRRRAIKQLLTARAGSSTPQRSASG